MGYLYEKIRLVEKEQVYPALEDSQLLAKAVEDYAFGKVLDLGTGSGIQGIIAGLRNCTVTFADIDDNALAAAKMNAKLNEVKGKFLKTDIFSNVKGKYNTIIFNPPYLPTGETNRRHIALDGGADGRELIDRFLKEYKKHVESVHVVLMLESSLNGFEKDAEKLKADIVGRTHYFFEDLVVLKFR